MSTANVRFFSESLGKWTEYNVILPDVGRGPFPTVVQLHGLSENCRSWIERSNIVRYAEPLALAIVFPDGGTSGYVDWKESERFHRQGYESMIVHDLPLHLRRHFNVSSGPWGIGGHSMGGYGSMRLGLKYPEVFSSIWAHSAAFQIDRDFDPDLTKSGVSGDLDIFEHAANLATRESAPVISFDCGIDDERIGQNRALHAHLLDLGLAHHYAENAGAHTWEYWDMHIQAALEQHSRMLSESS